jgi:ABC-2 type transport system ATP-binding protein
MCYLQIEHFYKRYRNKTVELPSITINSPITLILGKNGSGKSTLLKAITKQISFQGTISKQLKISYMPEFPSFPLDITVKEFLLNLYQPSNNDYDYNQLLTVFGLRSKVNAYIKDLSKGMKTKLNVIQCLMRNAELYCLDEPFNGLDEKSKKILISLIQSKQDHYFLITSHENVEWEKKVEVIHL